MSVPSRPENDQEEGAARRGPGDSELLAYTEALNSGLEQIAGQYGEHVVFVWEDPVIFGGGHFVLYPEEHTSSRFAIEEHYTDTDWSDPDRVATSWTWVYETRLRQPSGDYPWVVLAQGEVQPGDYQQLLELATAWAKNTSELAIRAQALDSDLTVPVSRYAPEAPRNALS